MLSELEEVPYGYIALLSFLRQKYFTIIITGRKKSGKSALMYHLMEIIHQANPSLKAYIVNLPVSMKKYLPSWIEITNKYSVDRLYNCIIGFEESALVASARNWYKNYNRLLSQLMAISAHKLQRQIFVIQSMTLLDRNIIALTDALFVKPYSYIGYRIEREEVREIIARAWYEYEKNNILSFKEQRKYAVVFDVPDHPEPFLYKYDLPSFWSEELSYAWSSWTFDSEREEKVSISEQIRKLVASGYTWDQIKEEFSNYRNIKSLRAMYDRARRKLREEGIIS